MEKTKRRLVKHHTFVLLDSHCESFVGHVSKTVPDETYTLREIVQRFRRGQPTDPGMMREGTYDPDPSHDNPDLEKVHGMDLYDKAEFVDSLRSSVKEAEDKVKVHLDKKAAQAAKEAANRAADKKLIEDLRSKGATGDVPPKG